MKSKRTIKNAISQKRGAKKIKRRQTQTKLQYVDKLRKHKMAAQIREGISTMPASSPQTPPVVDNTKPDISTEKPE